ncbi:hypothetical protein [Phenylobacterium sp.]|uniref:hypothetical protein n=1 Tax=Phenylobacterium sp. TaxID=1871053 RepID=UPI00272FEEC9|nr:hypothetical protein [Phenylobacterium sp.]MDP1874970.1 hypothetical protein [Phenylobacterium sp.]MDP3488500.1 hypothetical protein [Phenylobacterium sp.]
MRALLSTVAVGLFLAACGPQTPEPAGPSPSAAAQRSQSPAVVGPILITFNETGAGEINGATPFSLRSVGDYFPNSTVQRAGPSGSGVITVSRPDGLRLELHPGADPKQVGKIVGLAGPVVGPLGEEIGSDWQSLGFDAESCGRGQDDMSHALICYRAGAPRLGYVVDLPGFEGLEDQTPEAEYLDQSARLSAFMWTAAEV